MENQLTQFVEITTDFFINIHIKNSTIDTTYGMPVKDFIKILNSGFPNDDLDHLGSKDDKA